jgi:hypothetical protein
MRIAGSNFPANSLTQLRKDLSDQAQQKQLDNQQHEDQRVELARREEFAQQHDDLITRGIEASAEAVRSSRQQRLDDIQAQDLPRRNQVAVQTFLENVPSPEEQLGIELAGIDTFA